MSLDLESHLRRQVAVSRAIFGPGERTAGVSDHIRKELEEIARELTPFGRANEWVDVVILALDGLTRALVADLCQDGIPGVDITDYVARQASEMIRKKQGRNEWREWPDWRTADPNKAIEHNRSSGE